MLPELPEEAEVEPVAEPPLVLADEEFLSPDRFVPNTESKSCPMPCMVLQPPSKASVTTIAEIRQAIT